MAGAFTHPCAGAIGRARLLRRVYAVVQCQRCLGTLHVIDARATEWACPACRQAMPVEAFRWVGAEAHQAEALRLAQTWNRRLERGLSWTEALEFRRLVP